MKKWTFLSALVLLLMACDTPMPSKVGEPFIDFIDNDIIHLLDGRKMPISGLGKPDQTTFFLVRHAEKLPDGSDPKLSELGTARAEKLAKILKKVPLNRICSTEYHRTRDTAGPLAFDQAVPMVYYPPRDQAEYFANYINGGQGMNVLVVGHSNTIPELLNILTGEEKYQSLGHDAYNDLFIVISKGPNKAKVLELKY